MQDFSEIEHISYIKNTLLPKLNNFSTNLEAYYKKYDNLKAIIRQFDKDISLKSNKVELSLLKKDFENTFINNQKWE